MSLPLEQRKYASSKFLGEVKETQRLGTKEFLSTLLNQNLEPNYRPKTHVLVFQIK